MSKLSPTYFAASVVLALIGASASAATSIVSTPRVVPGTAMTATAKSPSLTAAAPTATASTSTSGGSSSGTSTDGTTTGTSTGTSTDGTTTGGTTSTTAAAGGTATATPTVFANARARGVIIIDNGLDANGERVGGQVVAEGTSGLSPNASASGLSPNALAETDVIATQSGSSVIVPELSAVERKELRKRHNVGKNQQLLNTIAPRTSVDRTGQMPDDPPTPALTSSR